MGGNASRGRASKAQPTDGDDARGNPPRRARHTHPGVLGFYVLEGTITVEHEGRPATTYKAGDLLHIDAGKIHLDINAGNVPVKLIGTLVAEKGKPLSTPAP